ncbi:MAG: alpha/beta hydrolase [Steroidobacteraceae bacterium]
MTGNRRGVVPVLLIAMPRDARTMLARQWVVLRIILAACTVLFCARATAATGAPSLSINLDVFEHQKHRVALPNGIDLAYVELGARKGKPVVLIHGYTDNARDWVPLVPYLSPDFRLILVDIRGHGGSSKPECCYTRVDFAYDIKLLLDRLSIARADIIGHSLGSIIAQTFAETWPERTERVVLISSTGGQRAGGPTPKSSLDFGAEVRKLKEPIDPDSPFMIAWWNSPTPVDEDFIRRQRKDSAAIPLKVWLAVLDQGLSSVSSTDLQATLPQLRAPTLLIWGSQDPIFGEDARQSLRDALPTAQVKIFEGLGHNPFWEDPRAVAATINEFLAAKAP